jgi:hypothetical protein
VSLDGSEVAIALGRARNLDATHQVGGGVFGGGGGGEGWPVIQPHRLCGA